MHDTAMNVVREQLFLLCHSLVYCAMSGSIRSAFHFGGQIEFMKQVQALVGAVKLCSQTEMHPT